MLKVVALWNIPEQISEEEFEHWYRTSHIFDAQKIPGLRKYTVNKVADSEKANSRYYRMAELYFDSLQAAKEALESPEWRHAFKDAKDKIADHVRLFFETEEILN